MRKLLKVAIAILLVMTMLPINKVIAEGKSKLTIHFNKADQQYDDWTIWTWDTGTISDEVKPTHQDDYGLIWEYEVETASNVGLIIRKGDWEVKNCADDTRIQVDGDTEVWFLEGDCTIYTENPTDLAGERKELGKVEVDTSEVVSGEEAAAQLYIHYYRYEEDYNSWNIWSWVTGKEGKSYNFDSEDSFGVISQINYKELDDSKSVGFIVRRGNWQQKDIGEDRIVKFTSNDLVDGKYIKHIYLLEGDKVIYSNGNIDKSPRVKTVEMTSLSTIRINGAKVKAKEEITVIDSKNNELPIKNILQKDGKISLLMDSELALNEEYTVLVDGYAGKYPVLLSGLYDTKVFSEMFTYTGDDLGFTLKDNSTQFRVWAPVAKEVSLNLYESGDYRKGDLIKTIQMQRDVKGTWIANVDENLSGTYYTYSVNNTGEFVEAADPYAFASGVNGHRSMVIDLRSTNPENFIGHKKPKFTNFVDSIIYELHVRDLSTHESSGITNVGKFIGVVEEGTKSPSGERTGLDHLKELGITHLHLLPSFDHRSIDETRLEDNDFNWGYDPYNYNVVEGSYSSNPFLGEVRIEEFKEMVLGLHQNDIRVVMDVVYNHTGASLDSHLNKIVPGYYYRTVNGNFSNGSGCGNETASERPMVRKMIVDSVKYWANEYQIDGFRFDLMALHDIETMNSIRQELDKIDSDIIIYGEGWTGGGTPLPEKEQALKVNVKRMDGIAVFSDDIRDGIKGSVFDSKDKGFVSGDYSKAMGVKFGIVGGVKHEDVNWNYSTNRPDQIINYVSAHDNLTLWDKLLASNGEENTIDELIKMHNMSNAIVLTSQGVPFLHAGVEMMRSKDGDHNSYTSSDEVNQIDWDLKTENKEVFNYYKGLIKLRKARDEFRLNSADDIQKRISFYDTENGVIAYQISVDNNNDTQVVFNATGEKQVVEAPFGFYRIVVKDSKAGNKILGFSTGKMEVKPFTTMIMVGATKELIIAFSALLFVIVGLFCLRKYKRA